MNLDLLNTKELNELIAAANARIAQIAATERQEVRAKLIALAKENGYDASDLISGATTNVVSIKSGKTRKPAAPKYQHPTDGRTWAGRGIKPNWVKEWEAAGRSLDEVAIAKAA